MTKPLEVWVVDDDASLAEMLMIVLRQEGFEGRICPRGDLALDAFREFRPDLVLLDVMLPGYDGLEVCPTQRGFVVGPAQGRIGTG